MLERFNQLYQQIILESRKDSYIEQLNNKHINPSNDLAEYIYSFNNPKKEKCALHWLLKGTIKLPEDQDKVDKAFNLIDKQHLNYQQFNSPEEVINRSDKSTLRINNQDQQFNPDKESTFSNKKELGDGIVVYQVQSSIQGQAAVRRAVDVNWGYDKNPWCIITRDKNELDGDAWENWNYYSAYPKRIAFKNGKLLAFCANDKKEITWWDKEDNSSETIPGTNVKDDFEFIKKYCL